MYLEGVESYLPYGCPRRLDEVKVKVEHGDTPRRASDLSFTLSVPFLNIPIQTRRTRPNPLLTPAQSVLLDF